LTIQVTLRRFAVFLAIGLACALYLADLTGMGLVSADEPRYAEIGREMAASGDWITPHLWGKPWFEKPALLYWMTASGFRAGLGPELAPRLPVALVSLAFLVFFWFAVKAEWGAETAWCAVGMLATSAGWLAYSHAAVTDLPMSAFFSAAVLLAARRRARWIASAVCLAMAALGKGLVPLVLFAPVLAMAMTAKESRPAAGRALAAAAVFCAVALPWYVVCTLRNGAEFPRVFFVEQTFGRFKSDALQHAQPWWFYLPVAVLILYPWFPLLRYARPADRRAWTLAAVTIFGLIFFSAMKNKLPGYLLPLLPATCALMAGGYVKAGRPAWPVAAVIALLGLLPMAASVVPEALAIGIRRAHFGGAAVWPVVVAMAIGAGVAFTVRGFGRFVISAALAGGALLWFQFTAFPAIDGAASARPYWLAHHPDCAPRVSRSLLYGLEYYAGRQLAPCSIDRTRSPLYGTERR
jgi:4-amino-4-deoxy-L-arabinose transferase-like glycosyltransferase